MEMICDDLVEAMMQVPKNIFKSIILKTIDFINSQKGIMVEPERVTERKGRPSLKSLSSTKRDSSRF